jgi:hypothetical protein
MKNNLYNRLFHKHKLEQQLREEAAERHLRDQLAFNRLHSATRPIPLPFYKEYPETFVTPPVKEKVHKTEERKKEDEDTYTPFPVFIPTSPSLSFEPSSSPVEEEQPTFSPGGGSFGGAGASTSWELTSESSAAEHEPESSPSYEAAPEPSPEPVSEPSYSSSESASSSESSSSSDSSSSDSSSSDSSSSSGD